MQGGGSRHKILSYIDSRKYKFMRMYSREVETVNEFEIYKFFIFNFLLDFSFPFLGNYGNGISSA